MAETAAREVLLTFKVVTDEASRSRAAKALQDSVKQEMQNLKQVESERLRSQRNTDRDSEKAAKEQERRDLRVFREKMRVIKERDREEQRIARESERRAAKEERDEQRRADAVFRTRQKLARDKERIAAKEAADAEKSANARVRAEEQASNKRREANARATEGFRMMVGGIGQAVRALGYLAASDEKSAQEMAKVVLVVEGTVAALQTVTNIGYGAVKMWQAYKAAAAAAAAASAVGSVASGVAGAAGGRLAGGAAAGAAGGAIAGKAGLAAYAAPVTAGLAALGSVGSVGLQLGELATGRAWMPGSWTGRVAGWEVGAANWAGKKFGYDMVGDLASERSTTRAGQAMTARDIRNLTAYRDASIAGAGRQMGWAREDASWQLGEQSIGGATARRQRAEADVAATRRELAALPQLGQTGFNEAAEVEGQKKLAEQLARVLELRKQEVDLVRTGSAAKIAGIRDTIQGLEQEAEAHKRLAREAEQGKRSTLERLGSMSAVERAQAIEAKKAVDAGTATVEQEQIVSGLVQSGGKTDTKLREQWRERAMAAGGGIFTEDFDEKRATEEKAAREITARVKDERKLLVKIERDDKALVEQVAKEAAKQMEERDKLLWPLIEKAIREEVGARMQQGRPNLNPVLRQ